MGQWLSAIGGYSIEQVGEFKTDTEKTGLDYCCTDYYPSGVTAFGIVSTLVCATWTDYTRVRWPVLVYMCFCCTIAAICILIWSSPTGVKFFAYCEPRGDVSR
jgi:ACS family pantothenate transporter-like MFS transporter